MRCKLTIYTHRVAGKYYTLRYIIWMQLTCLTTSINLVCIKLRAGLQKNIHPWTANKNYVFLSILQAEFLWPINSPCLLHDAPLTKFREKPNIIYLISNDISKKTKKNILVHLHTKYTHVIDKLTSKRWTSFGHKM